MELREQWSRRGKGVKGRRHRERTFQRSGGKAQMSDRLKTAVCGPQEDRGPRSAGSTQATQAVE